MKLKYEFSIREIVGDYVIIPLGEAALKISGMITTNDVGAFIWKQLQMDITKKELVERVLTEFQIDVETATADVEEFIEQLSKLDIISEE